MPKTSHSKTRVAHKGPRHTADPDRRVKYTLRFRRKGEELEPQTKVVRRHRRSEERELSPAAKQLSDRQARRQARQQAKEELEQRRREFNSNGALAPAEDEEPAPTG